MGGERVRQRFVAMGVLVGAFAVASSRPAQAGLTIKPNWYPGGLDVAVDGRGLLERVSVEFRLRGADAAVVCNWPATTTTAAVPRIDVPCPAMGPRAYVRLDETAPGVVALSFDLGRETRLAAVDGVVVTAMLAGFDQGVAYARAEPWWMRPVFVRQQNFVPVETQLVLARRADDTVALLPLSAGGALGFVRGANVPVTAGGLTVALEARAPWSATRGPIAVVAASPSPYDAVAAAYRHGLTALGSPGRLRGDKPYPKPFERFGFCTWNTFYEQQTTANLLSAARSIRASGFPLGFFIVDAGWQHATGGPAFFQRLRGFGADEAKIPGGLPSLVRDLRAESGAPTIGVWHALQGVPGGVDPSSPLAREQRAHLWTGADGVVIPDPTGPAGAGFYRDYYRVLKDAGVDLVKVDFQNWNEHHVRGRLPLFRALQQSTHNLQAAATEAFGDAIIHCMSMGHGLLLGLREGNVVRNSLDYLLPEGPVGHRRHVINNVFNALAVSQVAYPDFDMWEAHGPFARYHAVLRALSGGPVYVTGDPARQDWTLLRAFVADDGTLLRADAPVVPTRAALFVDAGTARVPLTGFTRSGAAGLLGAFNVHEAGEPVDGQWRVADVEGLAGDRFAVREHFSRRLSLVGRDEALPIHLDADQAALFTAVPIARGAAVFGLLEKFVAPRTVEAVQDDGAILRVRVAGAGTLGVWLDRPSRAVRVDGANTKGRVADGLLEIALGAGVHQVEIER
jgi:raffinose synthase